MSDTTQEQQQQLDWDALLRSLQEAKNAEANKSGKKGSDEERERRRDQEKKEKKTSEIKTAEEVLGKVAKTSIQETPHTALREYYSALAKGLEVLKESGTEPAKQAAMRQSMAQIHDTLVGSIRSEITRLDHDQPITPLADTAVDTLVHALVDKDKSFADLDTTSQVELGNKMLLLAGYLRKQAPAYGIELKGFEFNNLASLERRGMDIVMSIKGAKGITLLKEPGDQGYVEQEKQLLAFMADPTERIRDSFLQPITINGDRKSTRLNSSHRL